MKPKMRLPPGTLGIAGKHVASWALAAVTLAVTSAVCQGNGLEIGFDAGTVFPLESSDIQLNSEFVTVRLGGFETSQVECQYNLKNLTSSPQTISMAFVTAIPYGQPFHADIVHDRGFRVHISAEPNKAVPVRLVRLDDSRWKDILSYPPDSLPAWEVTFRPRQEVILNITYSVAWTGGCDGSNCGFSMSYHASPARLWAGPIEFASINFEFDPLTAVMMGCNPDYAKCLTLSAKPEGFRQSPRGFAWEMKNWEPDQDFVVRAEWNDSDIR